MHIPRALLSLVLATTLFASMNPTFALGPRSCASVCETAGLARSFREWIQRPVAGGQDVISQTCKHLPILVIGAGPAGLAVMRALKEAGVAFEGVEKHWREGGLWDQQNPDSAAYDHLITNASKATMSLGDPFPKDWPAYLPRELAHQYLMEYSQRHSLRDSIRFNTRALRPRKTEEGAWEVDFADEATGTKSTARYRALIIATGYNNRENIYYPQDLWDEAQKAGIRTLHSSDYRNASPYRDRRVLVLGVGNSGAEIATAVSQVARRTLVGVRTTPWIAPLWVGPVPADVFAQGHLLPHSWELKIFRWLQRRLVGHPEKDLGFPPLTYDILDRLPISERGIAEAIRNQHVLIRSNVKAIVDGKAIFENAEQSPEPIDDLIFATGYHRRYRFLPKQYADLDKADFKPMFHLFHPAEPGLVFIPEVIVPQGAWPMFWEQGQAIAAYFASENKDSAKVSEFNSRRQTLPPDYKGKIFVLADDYHVDPEIYARILKDFRHWIRQP